MEKEKKNYKYIIYARKSTEDEGRQILSIESQIKELNELAQKKELEFITVLQESKSAKKKGRPVFNEMLRMIKKGQAQGIIAWKLDRLSRNPFDSAQIEIMLQEGIIKHIVTFDRECTPKDNVVMRALEFSMANQYIIDLSNNVKRGNRFKLENGVLPGLAPLGYLNHADEFGNKSIIKDPKTFNLVKKMWYLLLTGKKPEYILEIANEKWGIKTPKRKRRGGRPLARSAIYRLFSNPFYAGIIQRKQDNELWEGKGIHKPMISIAEFEKAQKILGRDSQPRPKRHEFKYTGIIKCSECGGMVTAEERFKKTLSGISHYIYYHCSKRKKGVKCRQGAIREEDLEVQVVYFLDQITINDKYRDWAIKNFQTTKDNEKQETEGIIKSLNSSLKKTEVSLKRLTDLLIDRMLDNEEYTKRKHELQRQKWQVEEKINDIEANAKKWFELGEDLIIWLNQAINWFIEGNKELQREILKFIGSNHVLTDRKLFIEAKIPFQIKDTFQESPIMWAKWDDVCNFLLNEASLHYIPPLIKKKIDSFRKSLDKK
ncbi:recombinase family protein [Thermodesulfobacteriota bacterium]